MAKNNDNEGWQMIAYFAIAVIVVSLFVVGMRLTGFVVDSAVLNVTVDKTAAINFTSDFINFGNGSVNVGAPSATLESDVANAVGGSWTYGTQNFVLENIGNINLSLKLKTGKDAAGFLGGTSPEYQYKVENLDVGSCTSGLPSGWINVSILDTTICNNFEFNSSIDTVKINVRLVIPSDSNSGTGAFTDTFTVTGAI